jgi:hypothetical protein
MLLGQRFSLLCSGFQVASCKGLVVRFFKQDAQSENERQRRRRANAMHRFNPTDAVYILPRFAHLYPSSSATVAGVKLDPHRPIFNTYTVEFADGSNATMFEFQIIEDLPNYKTMIASTVFDSRRQAASVQVRGESSGGQIIFRTHQFDLDLKIRIETSRASLLGQILEKGTTNLLKRLPAVLIKEGRPICRATSDDTGVFKFTDVPRGLLNLLLTLPQYSVRILGEFTIW